jgi:hypothetical protein
VARGAVIDFIARHVRGGAGIPGERDTLIGTSGELNKQHQRTAQNQIEDQPLRPATNCFALHTTPDAAGLPACFAPDFIVEYFPKVKKNRFEKGKNSKSA